MKLKELLEQEFASGKVNPEDPDSGNEHLAKAVEAITRDCKQFLKQMEGRLALRGTRSSANNGLANQYLFKRSVRDDRKGMNTRPELQAEYDRWFNQHFGVKPRSAGIFTTGSAKEAKSYGTVYAVFPIGEFKYIWSPKVDDLFFDNKKDTVADAFAFLDQAEYQDTDLAAGLDSGNELIIVCKEYYSVLCHTPELRADLLMMLGFDG